VTRPRARPFELPAQLGQAEGAKRRETEAFVVLSLLREREKEGLEACRRRLIRVAAGRRRETVDARADKRE